MTTKDRTFITVGISGYTEDTQFALAKPAILSYGSIVKPSHFEWKVRDLYRPSEHIEKESPIILPHKPLQISEGACIQVVTREFVNLLCQIDPSIPGHTKSESLAIRPVTLDQHIADIQRLLKLNEEFPTSRKLWIERHLNRSLDLIAEHQRNRYNLET